MTKRFRPYPASREVLEKIAVKHHLKWQEIAEVFQGKVKLFRTHVHDQYGEARYLILGKTLAGRYVTIFFVAVPPDQAKVITARDMDNKEKRRFKGK